MRRRCPCVALCDSNRSLRVWLGIDSGSTTTKLALVADDGEVIDSFYASNEGEPLAIARDALSLCAIDTLRRAFNSISRVWA